MNHETEVLSHSFRKTENDYGTRGMRYALFLLFDLLYLPHCNFYRNNGMTRGGFSLIISIFDAVELPFQCDPTLPVYGPHPHPPQFRRPEDDPSLHPGFLPLLPILTATHDRDDKLPPSFQYKPLIHSQERGAVEIRLRE
jgi:hypothetical protein